MSQRKKINVVNILRIFSSILIAAQLAAIGGSIVLSAILVIGNRSYFVSWLQQTPSTIFYSWIAVNSVAVAIAFPLRLIFSRNYSIVIRALVGVVSGAILYIFFLWQFGALNRDELLKSGWLPIIVGSIYGAAFTVSLKLAEALVAEWWPGSLHSKSELYRN